MSHHVLALTAMLLFTSAAAAQNDIRLPRDLEDWRAWVLHGEEFRQCPLVASVADASREHFRCAWPERLTLTLDGSAGQFEQRWQIYAPDWVRLPGSAEHWPQDVRLDGAPAPVVLREGAPSLFLRTGTHAISGRLSWEARPESLPIDPRTGVVNLTLDGRRIAQPERPGGAVWLGKRRAAEQPERMDVQVYRLLHDEMPAKLTTLVRLQVSGDGREEVLARVLPDGFTPTSLRSVAPARLEPDGRLRVQVRAGTWDVMLEARGADVASEVARPAAEGTWAQDEIWSFAGEDRLRVAAAQGAEGIDPGQANVPREWRGFPAFRMPPEASLTVVERSRGLSIADDNHLTLARRMWLDFDHAGFTVVDVIRGTMRRDWRLGMEAPFRLESARVGTDNLLVTVNPGGEGTGVELRTPSVQLEAVARTTGTRGALPATGWNARLDGVRGTLILPPGHRLLAAIGADRAPEAWFERWGLWGLFGVLIVAFAAGWLGGRVLGAIALVGLLLTYQEGPGYIWLWANLLAAVALARVVPEGRLRRIAQGYRAISLAVLGVALLPFLWDQVRIALHPQLEQPYGRITTDLIALEAGAPVTADAELAEAPPPAASVRKLSSAGSRYESVLQRYAPGTLLQTGPGLPDWEYVTYEYSWSGPVEPAQSVRFVYISPTLLAIWRFAGVALLAALFIGLAQIGRGAPRGWPGILGNLPERLARRGAAASLLVAVLGGSLLAPAAQAEVPSAELLKELKARLTRAPECLPTCAEIASADVVVRGNTLDVTLRVSALAHVAVPMPEAGDRWQVDLVTLDGRSALALARESSGSALWVPLPSGARVVRMTGSLASAESIALSFPSVPRRISVTTDGWTASGVNEGRLLAGSLELTRARSGDDAERPLEGASEFPLFVRVLREIDLGLDWVGRTTVSRVAPERAAFSTEIPLLAGESVLSESVEVRQSSGGARVALVGLERDQPMQTWVSGFARSETLELTAPDRAARSEVWRFHVSPEWNVSFEGFPAVMPEDLSGVWAFEFHPRPGERLRLNVSRPAPAAGSTFAIDSVQQRIRLGKRSTDAELRLAYRSTQGGRQSLNLPAEARVTGVVLDDRPVSLRPDQGVLSFGLLPGSHSVLVQWTTPEGTGVRMRPAPVDLHSPAGNVTTILELPEDRWPIWVSGTGVGPAVVYWAELVIFVITALILGRWRHSPLRTYEWLLLGLGVSTLSWSVLVLVAGWLFALRWREQWHGNVDRWQFNSVQVLLGTLTVVAVGTLVFAGVRQSLLAAPDMGIAGPGSFGNTFTWFVDRTQSALPRPQVISLPMWVYRTLMFAWALWIALALLKWLRWAWSAWKANRIWRSKTQAATTP